MTRKKAKRMSQPVKALQQATPVKTKYGQISASPFTSRQLAQAQILLAEALLAQAQAMYRQVTGEEPPQLAKF